MSDRRKDWDSIRFDLDLCAIEASLHPKPTRGI